MTQSANSKFWQISFLLPKGLSHHGTERYSSIMEEVAHSVLARMIEDDNRWCLEMMFHAENPPNLDSVLSYFVHLPELSLTKEDLKLENIPDRNWLEHVYKEFPPIHVGDFFVYGEHYDGDVPDEMLKLQIGSAMAFGSGEHQTTQGCLLALQKLKKQGLEFNNILDMGCGSGILSVAAAKLWPQSKIIAIDIEEESTLSTLHHARTNNCVDSISAKTGNGYKTELVKDNAPYDLIISNILSSVLIELAEELGSNLKTEGFAVLAGLLERQIPQVTEAHSMHCLKLIDKNINDNWAILTLKR